MTATPINNSIYDLYHQFKLMARLNDGFYRAYGIGNLLTFFKRVDRGDSDVFDLLELGCVRRTRFDIKRRQKAGEVIELPGYGPIKFPERRLDEIAYDLERTYRGFYKNVAASIDKLTLAVYNVEDYKFLKDKKTLDINAALLGIMRTRFLKRLESSLYAYTKSVESQIQFQKKVLEAIDKGKVLTARDYRRLIALDDEFEITNIFNDLDAISETLFDVKRLKNDVTADQVVLEGLRDRAVSIQSGSDGVADMKLNRLKETLATKLKGKKVIIFTYYQDTANYLHSSLKGDVKWAHLAGAPVIQIITGSTKPDERESIVKRFAPISNTTSDEEGLAQRQRLKEHEIDILISTDVLSEGQNLQDAGVVINYDLHWNPVRMIQRAGRIDRLRSEHEVVWIYNCFPEEGLEALLGLVRRLQIRIQEIDRSIGLDATILGETISDKSLEEIRRLKDKDVSVLDELERSQEMVSVDDMRFPLIEALTMWGEEKVREIPMGIHSYKPSSYKGVFVAIKARDRHFWRVYPSDGSEPITDKRKIFHLVKSSDKNMPTQRGEPNFALLEKATKDVLDRIQSETKSARIRQPLKGLNLKLHRILNDINAQKTVDRQKLSRVNEVLQFVSLKPFDADPNIVRILDNHRNDENYRTLLDGLDSFFANNDLYLDTIEGPTIENIKRNDLSLVCFEYLV